MTAESLSLVFPSFLVLLRCGHFLPVGGATPSLPLWNVVMSRRTKKQMKGIK